MTALLTSSDMAVLSGEAAINNLKLLRQALLDDRLVPYLGPGLYERAPFPLVPEEVAKELNRRTPAPSRIRTNMWSVAQYIDSRKHRRTLQAYMAEIFAGKAEPLPFHHFLAGLKLGLVVDSWYDSTFAAALSASGRKDYVDVQGISRAGINLDQWYQAYGPDAAEVGADAAANALTVLYTPHGGVRPVANFLVADSDYVEVLTEIDIQTPIPEVVKERRTTRGFLYLGCRFHDQMLRTYARQIMKRSEGPHYAVADVGKLAKNEVKFYASQGITVLDVPLAEALSVLVG